ncbi:MAG: hypothetical protein HKN16_11220 [Saprospiraceae bacterium]|nr:hypothetical protein [Saprospiraceae bacterium]
MQNLEINLDKTYTAMDEYTLVVDYTAFPARHPAGGSAAITSDQGLFFVNPDGTQNKPQQIWTQGETEHNSRWFPTIDKPNERCTQEMLLTVQDRFVTLSNGLLVNSEKKQPGLRTDHWKMNQAHAPYLFMLAIGEFAVVEESWNEIPVSYYVEPEFEQDAKTIFQHTPEMLQFFSGLIDYDYPWDKYAQIVVRDYVSGAMENTTAVIFGDFVQAESKALIDNHNDRIVAHEMFHHWFGDLVTCESWANLTMNEGFANYSEYLWLEHKYGRDEADHAMRGDQEGYFESVSMGGSHPLIHFSYEDKEDMFDAHSYNKGGAILHMLRLFLGDEAFYAGLKKYLEDNRFSAVESHDLRLAMEKVSGKDLNWFFNQWFFDQGHPLVSIEHEYSESDKSYSVTITQSQDPDRAPAIFQMPLEVDIYLGKRMPIRKDIWVKKRKQTFSFPVPEKPVFVNVDAEKGMLWTKMENRPAESYIFQYFNAPKYMDRFESIDYVVTNDHPEKLSILKSALNDPHWVFRRKALKELPLSPERFELWDLVANKAEQDPDSRVREKALTRLAESGNPKYAPMLEGVVRKFRTYPDLGAAMNALSSLAPERAEALAGDLTEETNPRIINSIASVYGRLGKPEYLAFFKEKEAIIDGFDVFAFFDAYAQVVMNIKESEVQMGVLAGMKELASNPETSKWKRFSATRLIVNLRDFKLESGDENTANKLSGFIKEIISKEGDPQLRSFYGRF